VDLVCEFISELKRLEIWPEEFHRACSTRGIGNKDVELSEIYEAYQQDVAGAWSVRRRRTVSGRRGTCWRGEKEMTKHE